MRTRLFASLLLSALAMARMRGDTSTGAQGWLESLRGKVWHDEAPLADGSFRMTCVLEELDARGKVMKTLVLEHRRTFSRGEMSEELLSATEDGRDVLSRQRQAEAHPARRGSHARWSVDEVLAPPLPFLFAPKKAYRLALAAETADTRRIRYEPDGIGTRMRGGIGYVELDTADGLPVFQHFTPTPLPRFIRSLVTKVRFRRLSGIAVPESTETIGEGGLLFVKRSFRIRMRYHDWVLDIRQAPLLRRAATHEN